MRDTRRRLVIVAPSAYPLGGVQTWLDNVVRGLDATVWSTTVLLPSGVHSDASAYLREHALGEVRLVANATGSHEGRVRALMKALRKLEPEIVLCVNIVDAYDAVVRLRKRGKTAPRVAMALHGLESCYFRDIERYREVMDGVIVTNRLTEAVVTQICGFPKIRTKYAPCGVDVPAKLPVESTSDVLTLIFAGRLEAQEKRVMDLPVIANVLKQHKIPFRIRIAGAGPAEEDLRALFDSYKISVEFLGALDPKALRANLYHPGAIMLILSPQESGPLVAWEAMANGVAIVTSQFVGIGREGALVDGVNCLSFPVGDVQAAADAVIRMREPTLRKALVASGFDTVKSRYSLEASLNAWSRALADVLDMSPRESSVEKLPHPNGRLDLLLGVKLAEAVRRAFGVSYSHTSAGGEWPHSYGVDDNPEFRRKLTALDKSSGSLASSNE